MPIQDVLQRQYQQFVYEADQNETLKKFSKTIGVPPRYIAFGGIGVVVLLVCTNIFAGLITNLVGFLYPAYASFKAIESKGKDDDTKWLTYWVVYAFFNMVEYFIDYVLFWLPLYFVMKLIFLVYLVSEHTNGAEWLYRNILRQFFVAHVGEIDRGIERVERELASIQKKAVSKAADFANENAASIVAAAVTVTSEAAASVKKED